MKDEEKEKQMEVRKMHHVMPHDQIKISVNKFS